MWPSISLHLPGKLGREAVKVRGTIGPREGVQRKGSSFLQWSSCPLLSSHPVGGAQGTAHVGKSRGAGCQDNGEGRTLSSPHSCNDLPRGWMKGKGARTQATSPLAELVLPKEQHLPPNTPASPHPPPAAHKSLSPQEQSRYTNMCVPDAGVGGAGPPSHS